jgi:hypothetical protein
MIIDDEKYKLTTKNYIESENTKKQIVFGHTFNHDMRHFDGWLHRHHGKYLKTAAFTIDAAGFVYKHFDPKYQSKYFENLKMNNESIVILLENDGWLIKDVVKNKYITWIGDIYKQPNEVVIKRWRGYNYWAPYSTEQMNSALELVNDLCVEFSIPITSMIHNTKSEMSGYEGVIYKSNLERYYTDLSPSWDCESFKNNLETK